MKKISETIIFFGSGPVAAQSLELLAQKANIEAIITKPRPSHHKGDVPVIACAERLGISTFTAESRHELEELFSTHSFKSRLAILIDFGIIVSNKVINFFPLGIINSHFSILPEWRGPDPISYAVLSGQKYTGVSLMLLVERMDEGPLLGFADYNLSSEITTPELTEELIKLSDTLIDSIVPDYCSGGITPMPQTITGENISYSHKLSKKDGLIQWADPAIKIERKIRAFFEWPKSYTTLGNINVVITKAHVLDLHGNPGELGIKDKTPIVYCGEGALAIDKLKPTGKREMTGQAFLAGYKSRLPIPKNY